MSSDLGKGSKKIARASPGTRPRARSTEISLAALAPIDQEAQPAADIGSCQEAEAVITDLSRHVSLTAAD
jgi:hypothetical protein